MAGSPLRIHCKRAYEPAATNDGYRLLVDRLWPRGIRKSDLPLDDWNRSLAPSTQLRRWFGHDPAKWHSFCQRYHQELASTLQPETLKQLLALARHPGLTLIYAARDPLHNNAVALKEFLETQVAL